MNGVLCNWNATFQNRDRVTNLWRIRCFLTPRREYGLRIRAKAETDLITAYKSCAVPRQAHTVFVRRNGVGYRCRSERRISLDRRSQDLIKFLTAQGLRDTSNVGCSEMKICIVSA